MRLNFIRLYHRGDTIVEVMIAVAIVSSVLAGAFTVSQRSALAVRDSQERAEMAQQLQGQVELVRALAVNETNDISGVYKTSPKYFCMDNTTRDRKDFNAAFSSMPALQADNFSGYPTECQNIGGRYHVAITYNSTTKLFTFIGRWDGVGGAKKQQQFTYRVHPGVAAIPSGATPTGGPELCLAANRSDIFLTLDLSSSMNPVWDPATGITRAQQLKESSKLFVNNATVDTTGNNVGIIGFNNSPQLYHPLSGNKTSLTGAINTMTNATDTNYVPALDMSYYQLSNFSRPGVKKVLIFVSDGEPDDLPGVAAEINDLSSAGVVIYTVGIATDAAARTILQSMVRNGGYFQEATSASQLDGFMNNLAGDVDCT